MKRSLILLLAAGMVAASFATAEAAKKPVKTTLYLHGYSDLGEIDGADNFANATPPMAMDGTKPDGGTPKSMHSGTPGLNTRCTGFPVAFPTWQGNVTGTIVGDAKLTAHFVSPPTRVTARLWVDTPVFSCNEAYIEPVAEVVVEVPAGHSEVEIVFPKLKAKAGYNVLIQLLGAGTGSQGRVLYDAAEYASNLSFNCVPAKGSSCI